MTTAMRIRAIHMLKNESKVEVKDRNGKLLASVEMKKKEEK